MASNYVDNIKGDQHFKNLILSDCEFIISEFKGLSRELFEENDVLQYACSFKLIQISESAKKLSDDFRKQHNNIVWHVIYGLRNRIVHDYGSVDLRYLYDTLNNDIPDLYKKLK